jgi:hypothetical protein
MNPALAQGDKLSMDFARAAARIAGVSEREGAIVFQVANAYQAAGGQAAVFWRLAAGAGQIAIVAGGIALLYKLTRDLVKELKNAADAQKRLNEIEASSPEMAKRMRGVQIERMSGEFGAWAKAQEPEAKARAKWLDIASRDQAMWQGKWALLRLQIEKETAERTVLWQQEEAYRRQRIEMYIKEQDVTSRSVQQEIADMAARERLMGQRGGPGEEAMKAFGTKEWDALGRDEAERFDSFMRGFRERLERSLDQFADTVTEFFDRRDEQIGELTMDLDQALAAAAGADSVSRAMEIDRKYQQFLQQAGDDLQLRDKASAWRELEMSKIGGSGGNPLAMSGAYEKGSREAYSISVQQFTVQKQISAETRRTADGIAQLDRTIGLRKDSFIVAEF